MLSKLRRLCRPNIQSWSRLSQPTITIPLIHAKRRFDPETTMLCMQCEQTAHAKGCTSQGICGKWPETANMQDLLVYVNNGLCQYLHQLDEKNLSTELRERTRAHLMESMFSTLTNVNFSEDRMVEYIEETISIREQIKPIFRQIFPQQQEFERVQNSPSNFSIDESDESLNEQAQRLCSLYATKEFIGDVNCYGLRECAVYGLKGMVAYFEHAERMHKSTQKGCYSDEERDEIYGLIWGLQNDLCSNSKDLNFWLEVNDRVGATNMKVMDILDRAHNAMYGTPEPTQVTSTPNHGKAVLLSGHDVLEVQKVLDLIDKKGYDVDVYTHGELLPAHSYPKLKNHPRLVGHFGTAWQNQYKEFKIFPGAILMTSNCLMPPRTRYKGRIFTTGCVGYEGVTHVNTDDEKELDKILQTAMESAGFDDKSIAQWKEAKPHTTGYGHATVLSHADTILDAIKSGDLQHIFVIGGCDGTEKTRSYFTDLGGATPDNSIILTMGCGKFRLHQLELGDIGGIPRVLDMGQCNDAYGAMIVAMKLAEALGTDIHQLPLHYAVSWFEQKAVAVFLSLLHLGIRNIRLGPAMPAFFTDDVRKHLFDNLGLRQVDLKDANADLKQMLTETA
eukprot:188945_1